MREVPNPIIYKPLDTPKLLDLVDEMVARDDA